MTKYTDDFYRPTTTTRAGLMFPARAKSTARGFVIAQTPAEQQARQIIFMSQAERETCLLLLAMPDIWNVHDQPEPVAYTDFDGKSRHHRFDYLAEFKDGRKVAVAVKPAALVERTNFRASLEAIKRDLSPCFATDVYLVTERERHRTEVKNAAMLLFYRNQRDEAADQRVAEVAKTLHKDVSVEEFIDLSELKDRGFGAVVRAIYDGILSADIQKPISALTRIQRTGGSSCA